MQKMKCLYLRSGTSKGPFLDLRDLPENITERDQILLRMMGSPDEKQIDGLGGAAFVTSKVVMVQPSNRAGIDVDYLFAQVFIKEALVDTKPTCGNMMAGVGHLAIERAWVKATHPKTSISVYNFNTDTKIEIIIDTPNGVLNYVNGETAIDGVAGTGAPVLLNLFKVAGGATGKLFPLGNRKMNIQGVNVSMVDAGNLTIQTRATDFDLDGTEMPDYFEQHPEIMAKMEAVRLEAGRLAGLGDVSQSVLPKIILLSKPRAGGHIKSQYFTPKALHPTHAVSGAVSIATACKAAGTVAAEIATVSASNVEKIIVEHPSGQIPIEIEVEGKADTFDVVKAGTIRTVRKLMDGYVYF